MGYHGYKDASFKKKFQQLLLEMDVEATKIFQMYECESLRVNEEIGWEKILDEWVCDLKVVVQSDFAFLVGFPTHPDHNWVAFHFETMKAGAYWGGKWMIEANEEFMRKEWEDYEVDVRGDIKEERLEDFQQKIDTEYAQWGGHVIH